MRNLQIERIAQKQAMLTLEQHDQKVADEVAEGTNNVPSFNIACPTCGFRLLDVPNTTTKNIDGTFLCQCGCMRCGARVWRKT